MLGWIPDLQLLWNVLGAEQEFPGMQRGNALPWNAPVNFGNSSEKEIQSRNLGYNRCLSQGVGLQRIPNFFGLEGILNPNLPLCQVAPNFTQPWTFPSALEHGKDEQILDGFI